MLFKKLALASIANLISQVVTALSVLFMSPHLIRGLGQDQYGNWLLAVSLTSYLLFLDMGVASTAIRFLSVSLTTEGSETVSAIFTWFRRFYLNVGYSVLGGVLFLGAVLQLLNLRDSQRQFATVCLCLAFSSGVVFVCRPRIIMLRVKLRQDIISLVGICRVCLFSWFVWTYRLDIGLIWLAILHTVLTVLEQGALSCAAMGLLPEITCNKPSLGESVRIRRHAFTNVLASCSSTLYNSIDTQLLAAFVSASSVTQYGVGMRMPNQLFDLLQAVFGSHFIAAFGRIQSTENLGDQLVRLRLVQRVCAAVSLLSACLIFVLCPFFINRWLGPGFDDAILVTQVMIFPLAVGLTCVPAYSFLVAASMHGRFISLHLMCSVVNAIASTYLVRQMGLLGVVIPSALQMLFTAMALGWILKPVTGWRVMSYLRETIFQPMLVVVILGLPLSMGLVRWLQPESYLKMAGVALLNGAALLPFVWMGVIGQAAREFLKIKFRRWRNRAQPMDSARG